MIIAHHGAIWDHDFVAANWMTSTVPTQEEDACFFLVQGLGQVSGQIMYNYSGVLHIIIT